MTMAEQGQIFTDESRRMSNSLYEITSPAVETQQESELPIHDSSQRQSYEAVESWAPGLLTSLTNPPETDAVPVNELLESVPLRKNQKWTVEEYEILARNELRLLENGSYSVGTLHDLHPKRYNRSARAIQNKLHNSQKNEDYQRVRGKIRQEAATNEESADELPVLDTSSHSQASLQGNEEMDEAFNLLYVVICAKNELDMLGHAKLAETVQKLIEGKTSLDDLFTNFLSTLNSNECEKHAKRATKKKNKDRSNNTESENDSNHKKRKPRRSATKRKFTEWAKAQSLWAKSRRALWQEVRNGSRHEGGLTAENAYSHFNEKFSAESAIDDEPIKELNPPNKSVWVPIMQAELDEAIAKQKDRAPGLDMITYKTLNNAKAQMLALLNCCIYAKNIPSELKDSRTILLPKKESDNASDYRPITISSAVLRVLNSILASRISKSARFSPSQRGFLPGDGAMENILLLDHIIRKNKKGICIASVDVAKAFDTVSVQSILRAARNFGLPEGMCEYLRNIYTDSTTVIDYKQVKSAKINVRIGVKQGDPLSPLLFNMVIDEFLSSLEPDLGVKLGGCQISALAFADDLVLIAKDRYELKCLIQKCESFYAKRGLRLNPSKTVLLTKDNDNCLFESDILVAGVKPITVKSGEFFRYLGVHFDPSGRTPTNKNVVENLLLKLKQARLRPNQRLYLLVNHLIPSILHELILGRITAGLLTTLDNKIKRFVKEILHLSNWVADGFIYLPVKQGGLGIPLLRQFVPRILLKRLEKLRCAESPFIKAFARTHEFDKLIHKVKSLTQHRDNGTDWDLSKKSEHDRYLIEKTENIADGKSIRLFGEVPVGNDWLRGATNKLRGGEFVRAVQMRCNAAPCGSNARRHLRATKSDFVKCRFKCNFNEDLGHILNGCDITRNAQAYRHDQILSEIVNELSNKGHYVIREPTIMIENNGKRIPDIVVKRKETSEVWVMDVGVAFESNKDSLRDREDKKANYYTPIKAYVLDLMRKQGIIVPENAKYECRGIIFGSRGTIGIRSYKLLNETFEISKGQINELCESAIRNSIRAYKYFMRDRDRSRVGQGSQGHSRMSGTRLDREQAAATEQSRSRTVSDCGMNDGFVQSKRWLVEGCGIRSQGSQERPEDISPQLALSDASERSTRCDESRGNE
jgi:hypothetical protein